MRRQQDAMDHEIRVAWRTANYTRADKLPGLDKELERRRRATQPARPPSLQQQRANLEMLGDFLGKRLGKTRLKPKPKE